MINTCDYYTKDILEMTKNESINNFGYIEEKIRKGISKIKKKV